MTTMCVTSEDHNVPGLAFTDAGFAEQPHRLRPGARGPRRSYHRTAWQRANPVLRWTVDVLALEQARCEAELTFRDLARLAHLDRTTVSAMFRGQRNSTAGTLCQVCKVLNIEFESAVEYYWD